MFATDGSDSINSEIGAYSNNKGMTEAEILFTRKCYHAEINLVDEKIGEIVSAINT